MPFADHHDMVKTFPSNRSNHALGIGVLPGRARRNDHFPHVQRLGLTRKSFSIDLISVTDQMPRGRIPVLGAPVLRRRARRLEHLRYVAGDPLGSPFLRRLGLRQDRDDPGQFAWSDRLLNVVLEPCAQDPGPLLGTGESREGSGGRRAATSAASISASPGARAIPKPSAPWRAIWPRRAN